ncbi:hypothetical protein HWI79_1582 [Cryptosporidium felis]|nr:hypothetical protein HWI79_1582 [Cryptosporidium felis]
MAEINSRNQNNDNSEKDPSSVSSKLHTQFVEKRCEELEIPGIKLKPSPNCCQSLVVNLELGMLCSKAEKLREGRPNHSLDNYYDETCSPVRALKLLRDKESELLISSCVMVVEYLQVHGHKRNLQFNVEFLPTPLSLISSGSTLGNYEFQGNGPCALTLSMYFIRTCGRACNSNRPPVAGISNLPVACMEDCEQYSKDFCMVGCKRYGCSIQYYDCMNLLCGSSP